MWGVQGSSPWRNFSLFYFTWASEVDQERLPRGGDLRAVSALPKLAPAYLLNLILKHFAQWVPPLWSSFVSLNALYAILCEGTLFSYSLFLNVSLLPFFLCIVQTSAPLSLPPMTQFSDPQNGVVYTY